MALRAKGRECLFVQNGTVTMPPASHGLGKRGAQEKKRSSSRGALRRSTATAPQRAMRMRRGCRSAANKAPLGVQGRGGTLIWPMAEGRR